VTVVMTVVAHDEEDILDATLAFHLNVGVDLVLAVDHGSQDGTREILERYARTGHVRLTRRQSDEFRQSAWVTEMARTAATELGADWVLHADADEFWWPRGESIGAVLARIPPGIGIVRGLWRVFLPQLDSDASFAERMTVRLSPVAPINNPTSPYRPASKVAHRAHPDVSVGMGNDDASGAGLVPLQGWYPLEVLHFPLRRGDQVVRKYESVARSLPEARVGGHIQRAVDAVREGTLDDMLRSLGADPGAVEEGIERGVLVRDTRVRDVLRTLARVDELPRESEPRPTFLLPNDGAPLELEAPRSDLRDDVRFAIEAAVLAEADHVRSLRRLDELERRVAALERGAGPRAARTARRAVARPDGSAEAR